MLSLIKHHNIFLISLASQFTVGNELMQDYINLYVAMDNTAVLSTRV